MRKFKKYQDDRSSTFSFYDSLPPAHAHSASRTFFSSHPRSKDIAEKLYERRKSSSNSPKLSVRRKKAKLMMKFSKQANFLSLVSWINSLLV